MPDKQRTTFIQEIISYAKKQIPKNQLSLISAFIERYYAHVPLRDLKERSVRDLFGAVFSHWQLMCRRAPGEYKRRIFNPQLEKDGWESSHTILEFILDDQPFLVDSLCTEINRKGLTIHFLVHLGGVKLLRNAKHEIREVLPINSAVKGAFIEAPIYIEIDKQTNPKILEEIIVSLDRVINDVRMAVNDWQKMEAQVYFALEDMEKHKPPLPEPYVEEIKTFLRWLLSNHFTFLGFRSYKRTSKGKKTALRLIPDSGLGVLRDTSQSKTLRYYDDLPQKARELGLSNYPIILAKTNTRSTVHGGRYTDYISIKSFNQAGEVIGERWFIGLYTSTVYNDDPQNFPLIRQKITDVLQRSELPKNGHAYKALIHILKTLPKDDLFHATTDELFELSMNILQLQDRRCIRLFTRKDIFNRFISCLVYIPSDDFNVELCYRIEDILKKSLNALEISYTTLFSDSLLARIHFTVRIDPKKSHNYNFDKIEQEIIQVGQSWKDGLRENLVALFGEEKGNELAIRYERSFSAAYRENFHPAVAAKDIVHLEKLTIAHELETSIYQPPSYANNAFRFKLYHWGSTVPLSDAIPILERMGLRVIGEQPYCITYKNHETAWINDFNIVYSKGPLVNFQKISAAFQSAFNAIWHVKAENDRFNALVISAELPWHEIVLLRAYAKYIKQIGVTFSQDYIEQAVCNNPEIAKLLVELFLRHLDPSKERNTEKKINRNNNERRLLIDNIKLALTNVASLDEDRILRLFLNLIRATVRTNYFQKNETGELKPYLSFKFNPVKIHVLPQPKPLHEIFVYAVHFEGVHLRAGSVARGGIRWSDRREDFRREILGLMKAQQVKNAVIVPAGAKGGFVPKLIPSDADRDATQKEGIRCYQDFIRGLLDITDNLDKHGTVIHPKDTISLDADDPYLVVAADKGTATFSDIANQISKEYNFWLYDAFASGGSTGYDHKKISITARGAWESVKHHFQVLNINPSKHSFTAIGIGDMAGDVFGNGALLSKQMKLIAAFNGMHIFIDPNPDPTISFKERQRLFNLPRSTWEDYNPKIISKGGGVFKRNVKSITISNEMKKALNIDSEASLTPDDLIRAILKAPVDLLWNGGIGTFVKSKQETDMDVGDRANEGIRINGEDLRCRIVGEGGNLGFTQLGRIEYALHGGLINTDFIDNSGGVDCSDHEVNIKILLNDRIAKKQMTEKQRNALLAKMQDQVAALVLHNNYRQARATSLATNQSLPYLNLYQNYLREIAKQGRIDRKLEFLPSDEDFANRRAIQKGLTLPETAILLAYSKIILKTDILHSDLVKDPYLQHYIEYAFPPILRKAPYKNNFTHHRLSKEIMATQLSNAIVTDMGITFFYQMQNETRASLENIVRAYVIAVELFSLQSLREMIESLAIPTNLQTEMVLNVVRLMRRSIRWLLRNYPKGISIEKAIELFSRGIKQLNDASLSFVLTPAEKSSIKEKSQKWLSAGVPSAVAHQVANTGAMYSALDIIKISHDMGAKILEVAHLYFQLSEILELNVLHERVNDYPAENHWMLFARSVAKGDIGLHQRTLTANLYQFNKKNNLPKDSLTEWLEKNKEVIKNWQTVVTDMKNTQILDFAILMTIIRELSDLAQATK